MGTATEEPCPLCGYDAESDADAIAHAMADHPDECGYSDYTVADNKENSDL